ncbi:nucleotidyltransferase domain-containing protein [Candidatus Saganbacteria bacterium]|nr:nucleotidyltransferase domain-containing protein [Candidatus Saganbacteria bacterium]
MVYRKSKAINIINRFIAEAGKAIDIKEAILFGSYAKGSQKQWSDIDLAIISDSFKNQGFFDRLVFLGKLAWKAKTTEIEAIGFTPKEVLSASKLDFLSEIQKNGKIVYRG